ncbi:hypothetical protein [Gracilimonas mengyeensis]|uniref:Uncharacterized protein n=1 Tax=Gracilimonas mengyeensis TaxID=1302730 RepID=A0A521EDS5_9BACT|nr:hypothetical protein [Gracilimonas mengyeensis]SMO82069.1 hypothetical protein SAMN06265219_111126 [Gracilimonas mengyeensis]
MPIPKIFLSFLFFFVLFNCSVLAQSNITFNVNLKPQLEDSVFIPGQDKIEIYGNLYPLGMNKTLQLVDKAPIDSIYTVEIRFSRNYNGKNLRYNYVLRTDEGELRESNPRSINLQKGETELDAIYFNSFAW